MVTAGDDFCCDYHHLSRPKVEQALLRFVRPTETGKVLFETCPILPLPLDTATHEIPGYMYFYSTTIPSLKPTDFVYRLLKHVKSSDSVLIYALILLHRLAIFDEYLEINPYNVHRLLITAIVIAAKLLDHRYFSNKYYAQVAGISSLREMNNLEVQMLKLLEYRIHVTREELFDFYNNKTRSILDEY